MKDWSPTAAAESRSGDRLRGEIDYDLGGHSAFQCRNEVPGLTDTCLPAVFGPDRSSAVHFGGSCTPQLASAAYCYEGCSSRGVEWSAKVRIARRTYSGSRGQTWTRRVSSASANADVQPVVQRENSLVVTPCGREA